MKKVFSLMLILVTLLAFNSCSDNDNDEPSIQISKETLVGLWDAIEVQFNNDGKWINITNRPDLELEISFYEDGSYEGSGAFGDGEGTYTLKGNTIKTFVDGKLYATYVINSISGDMAELTMSMGDESMLVRAKKSKINLSANDPSIQVIIEQEDGMPIGLGYWISEKLEGNHFVYHHLCFMERLLDWDTYDYTLDKNGDWGINVNGEFVYAIQNAQIKKDYRYSFDGETLVLRDLDTKEEKTYKATVNGDNLTIIDGGETIISAKPFRFDTF